MKREKISGVYGLHNKINNKWYIGVSIDIFKRWITGKILFLRLFYIIAKFFGIHAHIN